MGPTSAFVPATKLNPVFVSTTTTSFHLKAQRQPTSPLHDHPHHHLVSPSQPYQGCSSTCWRISFLSYYISTGPNTFLRDLNDPKQDQSRLLSMSDFIGYVALTSPLGLNWSPLCVVAANMDSNRSVISLISKSDIRYEVLARALGRTTSHSSR